MKFKEIVIDYWEKYIIMCLQCRYEVLFLETVTKTDV